jgi:small subunit ribosomal protein S35
MGKNKTETDMEEYVWKNSSTEKGILQTLLQIKATEKNTQVNKKELLDTKEVEDYQSVLLFLKMKGKMKLTFFNTKNQ